MAAIVSGNTLGLFNTSLYVLGAQGGLGQASQGRAAEQVYVNAATGNLVVQNRDEVLIGRGPDAAVLRTYNSRGLLDDDNADNWRIGFYRRVHGLTGTVNTAGSTVRRTDAEGAEALYSYDAASGKYISAEGEGAYDTLTWSGGIWTWVDGSTRATEQYDFANDGRLTQAKDESGNTLSFTYTGALLTAVQTASGESTYLDYTGTNLTQVRTVAGALTLVRTSYSYDAFNRLAQITTDLTPENAADAKAYVTSYTYDGTSRRIATMTQSDGASLAFTYVQVAPEDWRVETLTDALGRVTRLAYDTAARKTTVTDPLGRQTILAHDSANRLASVTMAPVAGAPGRQLVYGYDASGNVSSVTDAKGNAVVYGYDANGNRIHERDAAGNVIERLYDANSRLLAETQYQAPDPDGAGAGQPSGALTTRYVYDAAMRLRFVVSAAGRVLEHRYDGFGQRVASIQYTAKAYELSGLGPTATLSEAQLTAWLPIDRSASVRVDSVYDFRGQLDTVTTYGAVDAAGNGVAAAKSVTKLVYDQAGNLLQTIDPRGTATAAAGDFQTTRVYDGLGRVLSTTDALGNVTLSDYQDAQRKTVVALANGLVRTSTYSAAGELIGVLESAQGTALGETKYFYDAAGRLRRTEDPSGIKTHVLYDEAGRQVARIDGDGSLTEYRYDANNNLTRTIRYATAVSVAGLSDTAGKPLEVSLASIRPTAGAADQSAWNVYDNANRLVRSIDAAGFVTEYIYDGAGRETSVLRLATPVKERALLVSATPGYYASTPDSAVTSITGDIDIRARVAAEDWTPSAVDTLVGKRGTAPQSYQLRIKSNGTLNLTWFQDGVTLIDIDSTVAIPAANGAAKWLRSTLDVDNGANGHVLKFYTSDDGVNWTQLGSTITRTGVTSIADGTNALAIGAASDGGQRFAGKVYYAEVRNGIGGSVVAKFDPFDAALNSTAPNPATFASSTGEVWTLHDPAVLVTTSAADRLTRRFYDGEGKLAGTLDAEGYLAENKYDAAGQLVESVAYASATDVALRSAGTLAQLRPAASAADVRSYNFYNARGQLARAVDGEGYLTEYVYDAAGNQTQAVRYATKLASVPASFPNQMTSVLKLPGADGSYASTPDSTANSITGDIDVRVRVALDDWTPSRLQGLASKDGWPSDIGFFFRAGPSGALEFSWSPTGAQAQQISRSSSEPVPATDGEPMWVRTTLDVDNGAGQYELKFYSSRDGAIWTQIGATLTGAATSLFDSSRPLSVGAVHGSGSWAMSGKLYYAEIRNGIDGAVVAKFSPPVGAATSTGAAFTSSTGEVWTLMGAATLAPVSVPDQIPSSAQDQVIRNTYDALNRLATRAGADGTVTQFTYDETGNLVKTVKAANTSEVRTLTAQYDKQGRLTAELSAKGAASLTGTETQALLDEIWAAHAVKHAYDAAGRRTSTTDANGRKTLFYYNADGALRYAINAAGEVRESAYDALGQVTHTIEYGTRLAPATLATLTGGLASAPLPEVGAIANVLLDSKTTYAYATTGLLSQSTDPLKNVTTQTYNAFGELASRTQAIDPAQTLVHNYSYDRRGLLTLTRWDPSGINTSLATVYDAFGRATQTTDPRGNIRKQSYDRLGRVVTSTDPLSKTQSTAYDAFDRVLTQTDALGKITTYSYDTAARSVTVTTPEGIRTKTVNNRHGQTVSITDGRGNTTTYAYDKNGNLTGVTAPAAGSIARAYDNADLLIQTTDAIGTKTAYTYDAANRVLTRTVDAGTGRLNLVTTYVYDAKGQTVKVTDPAGMVTETQYDLKGQVSQVAVDPAGLNLRTTYTYDGRGKTLEVTEGAGTTAARTTKYVYDKLGRRIEEHVDAAGLNLTTVYAYDKNDNVVTRTEAAGKPEARTTRYVYDANDRLIYSVDALGGVTQNLYDAEGRIVETRAYANAVGFAAEDRNLLVQSIKLDGVTIAPTAPGVTLDRGTGAAAFDGVDVIPGQESLFSSGALRFPWAALPTGSTTPVPKTLTVMARGTPVLGVYPTMQVRVDGVVVGSFNVTSSTSTAYTVNVNIATAAGHTIDVVFTNDASLAALPLAPSAGDITTRLIPAAGRDRVTKYAYDGDGRLIFTVDGLGAVRENVYDADGNVVRSIAYANPVAATSANSVAAIRAALVPNAGADRLTRTVYDAAGRATFTIDAAGFVAQRVYDNNGNTVKEVRYANALQGAFADNVAPQIVTAAPASGSYVIANASDRVARSIYDAAGRNRYGVDAEGYATERRFDALGRETSRIRYASRVSVGDGATVANMTALLPTALPATAVLEQAIYDAAGRLRDTVDGEGVVTRNAYDALGRKTEVTRAHGTSAASKTRYAYDAIGRVLEETQAVETAAAATTRYALDAFGNRLKLIDPRGVELAETDSAWALETRKGLGYVDAAGNAKTVGVLTAAEKDALRARYTTTQKFDALGRKTKTTDALGGAMSAAYDAFGNMVQGTDARSSVVYFYFNQRNESVLSVDPEGYATQTSYDAFGNVVKTVRFANKAVGTVSAAVPPAIVTVAPATGVYVLADAARDQVTTTAYDRRDLKVKVTDAEGKSETFEYDAYGNVRVHTDKNGNACGYDYDKADRKIAERLPISSKDSLGKKVQVVNRYEYDALGNRTREILAQGLPEERLTQYVYDKNGRLVETVEPRMLVQTPAASAGGGFQIGGGPLNLSFRQGTDAVLFSNTTLDASWPPIVGYGDGGLRGVWESNGPTFPLVIGGKQIGGNQTMVGFAASGATSMSFSYPTIIAPTSYMFRLYKGTPQGEVLIAVQSGGHTWIPTGVDEAGNPSAPYAANASAPMLPMLHFTGQPAGGRTLRLAYWPVSDPNNITELDLASYSPGTFSVMFPGALSGDYAYDARVFADDGEVLNHLTGTFSGAGTTTVAGQPLPTGTLQAPHTFKTYDARGNVLTETDAKGNVTRHYYDANDRAIATVDAERYLRVMSYDAAGNVIAARTYDDRIPNAVDLTALPNPAAIAGMNAGAFREIASRFNANNRLVEARSPEVLVFDRAQGLRTSALVTQVQYDAAGNAVLTVDARGNKTYSYYDKVGNRIAQVDALGYVTAWTVDAVGNVVKEAKYATALSSATLSTLSAASVPQTLVNQVSAANNPDDRITTYAYDRVNRKLQEGVLTSYSSVDSTTGTISTQSGTVVTQYIYDGVGNLLAKIAADGGRTDYIYDGRNRLVRQQDPAFTDASLASVRTTTELAYDGIGHLLTKTEKGTTQDAVTRYTYDPFGNRTKEIDAVGNPVTYYYDLNGNITVKHTRRVNPDGTQPAVDTLYGYDRVNRQIATQDALNFVYSVKYNAHGEIVAKGLNNLDQEYYEYDRAGRLIKTNKDDGVDRAYLYDANGNETARIQSAVQDTDLKPLAIGQIAGLSAAVVQVTQSEYDARNQLVKTYQAPMQFTDSTVNIQHVWVEALNDPFAGGTLTPSPGGALSLGFQWGNNSMLLTGNTVLNASWPPIRGYGDGAIRVVWQTNGFAFFNTGGNQTLTGFAASGATSISLAYGTIIKPTSYAVSVYKQTAQGEILIAAQSGAYAWQTTAVDENDSEVQAAANAAAVAIPSLLHFTGQRTEAASLQLWLWRADGAKPAAPVPVPKLVVNGAPVDGHFVFNSTNFPAGSYNYEFRTLDGAGKELDHVQGQMTLGSSPSVTSKQVDTIQPVQTDSASVPHVIVRSQSYNAFGEIDSETDGRLNVTTLAYDQRGNLIRKDDPLTEVTLANGAVVRQRPVTQYFYDAAGRVLGQRDANGNESSQRFDAAGHRLTEYHADHGTRSYSYDVFGDVVAMQNEIGERTTYAYDLAHRLIRLDRPTGAAFGNAARFETYAYDEADRRIRHTNALGHSELTYYDDAGRVKRTQSFGGVSTSYRYIYAAATGGSTTITMTGDGRTLEDTKDYFGRLLRHKDLGGHTFDYTYNEAGWLLRQTGDTNLGLAGNEQNIRFGYHQNGYLKEVEDTGVGMGTRTRYEYDENGNRVFEGYQGAGGVYYQWSRATYDELNRVKTVTDPKYGISYEYDANGNRRHVHARYHDGLNTGVPDEQNYWYLYDAMNRFLVTKGRLEGARGSGTIVAGPDGYDIAYNAASQRTGATYTENNATVSETYKYAADGLLTDTFLNEVLRSQRAYDAAGNVTGYTEFGPGGPAAGASRHLSRSYTADSKLQSENDGISTSSYSYDSAGNLLSVTTPQPGGTTQTTTYSYEYWDSAKQSQIKLQASNQSAPNWAPGFSNFTYDVNGHLTKVSDVAGDRHLSYRLDADGRILQRNEMIGTRSLRTQYYYYLNGIGIGDAGGFGVSRQDYASMLPQHHEQDVISTLSAELANGGDNLLFAKMVAGGNPRGLPLKGAAKKQVERYKAEQEAKRGQVVSSADFDYNFQPINDQYPAITPGTFTVRSSGETLQSVALAVWGDSSLWYLIADANGLSASPELIAGQTLVIPNVVANIHNNASTFRVYEAGELIGDTTPTLPDPPPPPEEDDCGGLGQILVMVVTVVVTLMPGGNPVLGNIAGQIVGNALGIQKGINIGSLAGSFIAGQLFGPATSVPGMMGIAAAGNAIGQGINIATGYQDRFSWRSVAIAALAAPIVNSLTNSIMGEVTQNGVPESQLSGPDYEEMTTFGRTLVPGRVNDSDFGARFTNAFATGVAYSVVSAAVNGRGRIDLRQIALQSFGDAVQSGSLVEELQATGGSSVAALTGRGSGYAASREQDDAGEQVHLSSSTEARIQRRDTRLDFADPYADALDGPSAANGGGRSSRNKSAAFDNEAQLVRDIGQGLLNASKGLANSVFNAGGEIVAGLSDLVRALTFDPNNRVAPPEYASAMAQSLQQEGAASTLWNIAKSPYTMGEHFGEAVVSGNPEASGEAIGDLGQMLLGARLAKPSRAGVLSGEASAGSAFVRATRAEDLNAVMSSASRRPAWMEGTEVVTEIVPSGTRYSIVVSDGQAAAIARDIAAARNVRALGDFATPENVPSQAFAKDKLAILVPEFKADVSYVVEVEVTRPLPVNRGIVGPQDNFKGGAVQVEFLVPKADRGLYLRMVGNPKPLKPN